MNYWFDRVSSSFFYIWCLNIQYCWGITMRYKGIPIDNISLFNTPRVYFELVGLLLRDCLEWGKGFIVDQGVVLIVSGIVWMIVANVSLFQGIYGFIGFALYWLILGVASSVGLGTGLHTFILYLGPFIAKVALVATMCGKVPDMLPSRWKFDHFGECGSKDGQSIGFFGIVLAVQLESILWGAGTAIGELPPYFVAKKAAETRAELIKMTHDAERSSHEVTLLGDESQVEQSSEQTSIVLKHEQELHHDMPLDEIQQMLQLRRKENLTLVEKTKLFIYTNMQKYGFWAILLCASIPNPLFDLAGITSGHFRIPFKTFFSAVLIGKAIIKVHIQMCFIIAIFRKSTLDFILNKIQKLNVGTAQYWRRMFQSKKKQLNQPNSYKQNKSFLSLLWDLFITGMILYFVKSILDAYVKEKAIKMRDH